MGVMMGGGGGGGSGSGSGSVQGLAHGCWMGVVEQEFGAIGAVRWAGPCEAGHCGGVGGWVCGGEGVGEEDCCEERWCDGFFRVGKGGKGVWVGNGGRGVAGKRREGKGRLIP